MTEWGKIGLRAKATGMLISIVTLTVYASVTIAWNTRYFQQNEKSVYDGTRLRIPREQWNWESYYFPFIKQPVPFTPKQFMSPSPEDCRKMCDFVPFPFDNPQDCQAACETPNVVLCKKKSAKKCLRHRGMPSHAVPVFKTHNWLTNVAIWTLKDYGLWFDKITASDLRYIHYGLNFADHPWTGRPDAPDAGKDRVIGIWDLEKRDIRNALFDKDKFFGSRYLVESRFRGGSPTRKDKRNRPNLYLSTRYKAELFDQDRISAADNLFHFPNRDAVKSATKSVRIRSFDLIDKDAVFEKCDVSVMQYGVVLYQLARQFWPGNRDARPNLFTLPRIYSHKGPGSPETGAIIINHMLGPGTHVERAYLPSTYLGGNPFICAPPSPRVKPKKNKNDICRWGRPTWPIWAPDNAQFIPSQDGDCFEHTCRDKLQLHCLKRPKCVQKFHAALKEQYPEKSSKTSLIYLGWALHMIQDTAMPRHAANWLGKVHQNIEREADRIIRLGYGMRSIEEGGFADWRQFQEEVEQIFGTDKSREELCRDLELSGSYRLDDESLKSLFDGVRDDAYEDRSRIKGRSKKHKSTRRKYIQIAFQRSIVASMKLLACLETK